MSTAHATSISREIRASRQMPGPQIQLRRLARVTGPNEAAIGKAPTKPPAHETVRAGRANRPGQVATPREMQTELQPHDLRAAATIPWRYDLERMRDRSAAPRQLFDRPRAPAQGRSAPRPV